MAYGTPRTRDEILPYYTDIRRGRAPPDEQLAQLVARYEAIAPPGTDVLSPLVDRTEAQARALQRALDDLAPGGHRVTLGMKHSPPTIEDGMDTLVRAGVGRIVCLVLAPHWSAFSVGEYVRRARAAAPDDLVVDAIESWATEPAFVEFLAHQVTAGRAALPSGTVVVFTAHSLPERIVATGDPYAAEVASTARAVADRSGLGPDEWRVAWQSAGRTPEPWLGPDILEVIDELGARGAAAVLVCACGFVADHLEVLYDLDIEAAARARQRGLAFARTACVNDDPSVMEALARRVVARS
jgi:ferrochelatase